MELRGEHRKLAVALAIVLDRSGSMGAAVAGGLTKMDLANAGAARSLQLLGPSDAAAVFAVDSEAHQVLPLARLGDERDRAVDAVSRIASGGGGIFVYRGLEAAWRELREAEVGQRHVILFADAADAEEPGDYPALVGEMVAGGTTLSVIGLGTPADRDADLLMGLAALGNGRIFFSADAATLPALFAQETVAVARSAFLEETVAVETHTEWRELAARPLAGLDAVDAYNLSYLREGASAALSSADEHEAPLVAFWRRGAGRAAAVSFPLGGDGSERVRAWPGYGDFAQTLARWLMGTPLPPGLGLRTRLEGTHLELELLFDRSWQERLAHSPARILLAGAPDKEASELVWERLAPGHFKASAPLETGRHYRGAVAIGETQLPFGPLEVAREAEWSFDPRQRSELVAVAAASGGRELDDLRDAWRSIAARVPRPLRTPVLLTILLLFLAEALRMRAGWHWPRPGLTARASTAARVPPVAAAAPPPVAEPEPVDSRATLAEQEEPAPEAERRARRFRDAKWRG